MAQYINKDALVAEIDRQIELLKPFLGACAGQIVAEANDKLSVLEELKNFLNTLEVKEVDLEKEYKDFIKCDNGRSMFETAKHFFELGKKYAEEQIMSNAEKVEISCASFAPLSSGNYKAGDKLLIIKEEQL